MTPHPLTLPLPPASSHPATLPASSHPASAPHLFSPCHCSSPLLTLPLLLASSHPATAPRLCSPCHCIPPLLTPSLPSPYGKRCTTSSKTRGRTCTWRTGRSHRLWCPSPRGPQMCRLSSTTWSRSVAQPPPAHRRVGKVSTGPRRGRGDDWCSCGALVVVVLLWWSCGGGGGGGGGLVVLVLALPLSRPMGDLFATGLGCRLTLS